MWLVAIAGWWAAPTAAHAVDPDLGEAGRWTISTERLFGFVHSSATASVGGVESSSSSQQFTLLGNPIGGQTVYSWPRLAFDGFLAPNVSLGGAAAYVNYAPTSGSLSGILLAPRVGFLAHLSPRVSIWLRGGFTYEYISTESGGVTLNQSILGLTLEAPLTIVIAPRIAVLVGPALDLGIAGNVSGSGGTEVDATGTDFGIQAGLLIFL